MSGFLLSLQPIEAKAVEQIVDNLSFVEESWAETVQEEAFTLAQVRVDRKDLWRPAVDTKTGASATLAGRIALSEAEWEQAKMLPYEGGLACRHILHAYLSDPGGFAATLNGAFGVVIACPREETLYVVTDRMGFFPLYWWRSTGATVVATHPDVLVGHTGHTHEFDLLSMAEMISAGTASHPFTYYRDIEVMSPGSVYTLRIDSAPTRSTYWEPRYEGEERLRVKELGEELEHALRGAVERRTLPSLGPTGVFLSGGADSRAVLYAACEPGEVTSITFYDIPNAEFETARRLAERVGSQHVGLQRDFEHYGLGAPKAVRVSGGMWNLLDAHYTEFLPQLRILGLDNLLSGCYADYLFKGLTSNRAYKTLFGKNIPSYDFAPFALQWFGSPARVAGKWELLIQEREQAVYEGLEVEDQSDDGRWQVELRRIRPAAQEATTATRLFLQRTLPWDPIFADTALIDIYQKVPPSLKLNGQVWENAVGRICRAGGNIANNNSLSRIGASQTTKTLAFLRGVAHRKLFGRDVDGTPLDGSVTRGSWPDFDHYVRHSRVVPDLWADPTPQTREVLTELIGVDPWSQPMEHWAKQGSLVFFRILTLKLWLDQQTL